MIGLILVFLSSVAFAQPTNFSFESVPTLGKGNRLPFNFLDMASDTYRIGSEWGKHSVEEKDLKNPAFQRAAMATAHVGGATGFFLGKLDGELVMATNHHVCPSASSCSWGSASFPLIEKSYEVKEFIGTWPNVDLSLFTIEASSAEDEEALLPYAGNFDFVNPLVAGQDLLTIGFGVAENPNRELMANEDADCKVFSPTGEFRLMSDPDDLNPADYQAWSFANGCDVSHGDSGSAMVDRVTGHVVGIIWTGRIPKNPRIQDSNYLKDLVGTNHADVWGELSYAVPALKIKEVLTQALSENNRSAFSKKMIRAVLAQ